MDKKNKKIEELRKKIEELEKQIEEYKNKYLRALADYQNLEKRLLKKEEEDRFKEKKRILLKFLCVIDDLERAEIFLKDIGLMQIKNKFIEILKSEGVEELSLLGKDFDPNLAEAIDIAEGEEDNKIVEVINKGYKINDQILRIAKVKVSKKVRN